MKKLLLTMIALPMATFATGAAAQPGRAMDGNMSNRIGALEARLEAGVQQGAIDRREARDLRRQIGDLRRLEVSYSRDGLSRSERTQLQQRMRTVREQLRMAGGNDWSNRYGWNEDDFDRDGPRFGNGYGSTRPGSVTYDRYGNPVPTNSYDGRGGPYEPTYDNNRRFGIGDIISNLVGNASLSRVPSNYSSRYRDRSDVYFRSDGRQILEIDARTNRVIRVHPMR